MKDKSYFAEKMREYRKRRKETNKDYYKRFVYAIDIDGKKYVFRNKGDIKIQKLDKNDILPNYIRTF